MKPFVVLISALLMGMAAPSYAKIESPCSVSSMLTSFTPCMSFLINASPSKPIPTSQCCKSLKALTNGGMNCLCDFVCGNIPFTIPFNKTLATFLPHACNISDVLLQCKSSASLAPSPGPIVYGFPAPSGLSSPPDSTVRTSSPQAASSVMSSQSLPSPPSVDSETPSFVDSGGDSLFTQSSSAMPSNNLAPSYILAALGFVVLNYY